MAVFGIIFDQFLERLLSHHVLNNSFRQFNMKPGIPPAIMDGNKIYRATLRGPPWSSLGWSQSSPGFVFWFQAQHSEGPRVLYGSDIVSEMDNDTCIAVHMISHRVSTVDIWLHINYFIIHSLR